MIKQLRYLCTLLLVAVASVAWAGEKTESVALSAGSYDTDHITWSSITGITVQQLQGSSTNAVSSNYISAPRLYKGHILSFTASDGYAIKSISITVNGTYYGNSMTAGTELNEITVTDNTTDVARTWTSTKGGTHVVSSVSDDGLSQIYIQNVASASNVQLRPTAISITYIAPDGALESVSFTMPITTIGVGRTQSIINNGGEAYTGTFTYKSSDTSVATVTDGIVTGVGEGSATITATASAVEGLYAESSETFEVTVVNPTFALSQAVILTNFEGAGSNYGTTYKWADFADADNNKVPNWYGIDYMKSTATGHTNELQLKANSSTILSPTFTSATGYSVTVTFTGDLTLTFENGEAQTLTSGTSVSTNSSSVGFTLSTGGSTVYIASIAIAPTGSVLPPTISGDTPFLSSTTVTITSEYDVYYTLDGKDPTTASILYTEPFEVAETTTVKAIAVDGSNNSEIAEKVFEKVTVLTVDEAIDYIGTLGEETSDIVFVKGIVSQVDSYNSNYKSITYWISDDGTTANQMQVYSGKGLESAGFSSKDDLQVGDEVTVSGNVKSYNGTPEFDKNNYLVAFYRPEAIVKAPVFSQAGGTYTGAQTITISCETEGAAIYYTIDGTDPTNESIEYSSPIVINKTTTLKAIAYDANNNKSSITTATYTIEEEGSDVIDLRGKTTALTFEAPLNGFIKGSGYNSYESVSLSGDDNVEYTGWSATDVMTGNGNCLQIKASTGKLVSPSILSDKGVKIEVTASTNTGAIVVGDETQNESITTGLTETNFTVIGANGKYAIISKIVITPLTEAPKAKPELIAENMVLNIGDEEPVTVSTNSEGPLTFISNDEEIATVVEGTTGYVVRALAVGTATITVSLAETTEFEAAETTFTVTVKDSKDLSAMFNFDDDYATLFSLEGTSSSESNAGDITEDVTAEVDGIQLTVSAAAEGATTPNRIWNSSPRLRMYSGTLTVAAPAGYLITGLVFNDNAKWNDGNAADSGTLTNKGWVGEARTVVITIAANTQLKYLNVLYKKADSAKVGDVNKDGYVTIADVTALVNIILGKVTTENNPDNYNFDAADVDGENGITIADVEALVNIILEKKN